MVEKLKEILNTLNVVNVCGEQNLCYQLGAIQMLRTLIEDAESKKEVSSNG